MEHASLMILADTQAGLFTWRQARASGYSPWQIRNRLADGRWQRVLGDVLSRAGGATSLSRKDRAALLAAGAGAVMSGPSAGRLHGMPVGETMPCITVPAERHKRVPGVRFLREKVEERDLILIEDMFVTRPDRTVFDCLRVLSEDKALTLLDRALQKRWITLENLASRVDRRKGCRDAGVLRKLLEEVTMGARSTLERLLIAAVTEAGIVGWVANYKVVDQSGVLVGVVDLAFPHLKLAVEVDGRAWHSSGDRFQRDRTRQNQLVNAGWTVLRFTWDDLTKRPGEVVAGILAAIARLGDSQI